MMNRTFFILCASLFLGFLAIPAVTFAAADLITLGTSPETPGPNQPVTVSVESYAVDINSAEIVWYEDGVVTKKGIAEKSLKTKTKDFGEAVLINVIIITPDGARFDKKFSLKPAEIDLLWEADTYVPPFYKGKALPTYKSNVKVTAIPRFNALYSDPMKYTYRWTMNRSQNIGEALGKTSVLVPVGYPDSPMPVSVEISLREKDERGKAYFTIPVGNPILLFYEFAPLLGVRFTRALSGLVPATETDFRIRAVPYFFSNDNYKNGTLLYEWKQNDRQINPGLNKNILTLKRLTMEEEAVSTKLKVVNSKRVLQEGDASVIIRFTQFTAGN